MKQEYIVGALMVLTIMIAGCLQSPIISESENREAPSDKDDKNVQGDAAGLPKGYVTVKPKEEISASEEDNYAIPEEREEEPIIEEEEILEEEEEIVEDEEDSMPIIMLGGNPGDTSSWSNLGRTADNKRNYPEDIDLSEIELKWNLELDGKIISSPIVSNGKIFAATTDGEESRIYAIDQLTREIIWEKDISGKTISTPAADNEAVYFSTRIGELTEGLIALDSADGDILWDSLAPINVAEKNSAKYDDKTVFVISNQDWQDIFSLVPVTTWTDIEGEIHKYPTLIYHEEEDGDIDVDSIIWFMQQYEPTDVTVVGDVDPIVTDLIVAPGHLGAGIAEEDIQSVTVEDTVLFWEHYGWLVYSEDDYATAMLSSTYASLNNIPLIIEGSVLDTEDNLASKSIICIGDAVPTIGVCNARYTAEELELIYLKATNTDKILLTDANLQHYKSSEMLTDKTGEIHKLYHKNSLSSPILASAKQELIVNIGDIEYDKVEQFLETKVEDLGMEPNYLTIVSSSNLIKMKDPTTPRYDGEDIIGYFYTSTDQVNYSDFDGDDLPDIATGRIMGLTSSDVSSYIARSLFHDVMPKTGNFSFISRDVNDWMYSAHHWTGIFNDMGYKADCSIVPETPQEELYDCEKLDLAEHKQGWIDNYYRREFVFYMDHGGTAYAGIYSWNMPELNNTMIIAAACSTCPGTSNTTVCVRALRRGALFWVGTVSLDYASDQLPRNTFNLIMKEGMAVGDSLMNSYYYGNCGVCDPDDPSEMSYLGRKVMLLGDPTLLYEPEYLLDDWLYWGHD